MTYRIAFPILTLLIAAGCSGRDATGPVAKTTSPSASAAVSASRNAGGDNGGGNSRRSGALHVTKEGSQYTRLAGGFCTITSANLKAIKVGTRVSYSVGSGASVLGRVGALVPAVPANSGVVVHVGRDR